MPIMSGPSDPSKNPYLPDDIWLEVAAEAEPLDLVFLSQCCRSLYLLFSDKEIWTKILRSVMHDCGPFIVEYSIDEMTLSNLQRAATGQGRWRRLLQAKAAASKGLAESKELSPSTLRVWTSLPTLRPIYHLVPGGRFLVTGDVCQWLTPVTHPGQRRHRVSLDLWDLGCTFVRTNAPPLPLNSWNFGCGIDSEGVCCNGSDLCITGVTSFLLVISFSSVPAQESRAVVVSVSLDREESTLTWYAFLDCSALITKTMIRGNLVLLQLNRTDVVLWDFMRSRGLRYCPTPEVSASNKHLMLTDGYVVLLISGGGEYEGIYVWDISRLDLKMLDANQPLTLAHCPPHSVQFSRWTPVPRAEAGGVVGSRALPCRPSNSLLFELIQGRDETSLTRFRLDLAKGSTPGSIETKLSALGTCSLPSIRHSSLPEQATGLCVVMPSSTKGRGGHCQLFAYEPAMTAEPALAVRPLMPTSMGVGYPLASCSYSGRVLCMRPLYGKGDGGRTYCADYLSDRRPRTPDSERRWSKPAKALATSLTKLLRLT